MPQEPPPPSAQPVSTPLNILPAVDPPAGAPPAEGGGDDDLSDVLRGLDASVGGASPPAAPSAPVTPPVAPAPREAPPPEGADDRAPSSPAPPSPPPLEAAQPAVPPVHIVPQPPQPPLGPGASSWWSVGRVAAIVFLIQLVTGTARFDAIVINRLVPAGLPFMDGVVRALLVALLATIALNVVGGW